MHFTGEIVILLYCMSINCRMIRCFTSIFKVSIRCQGDELRRTRWIRKESELVYFHEFTQITKKTTKGHEWVFLQTQQRADGRCLSNFLGTFFTREGSKQLLSQTDKLWVHLQCLLRMLNFFFFFFVMFLFDANLMQLDKVNLPTVPWWINRTQREYHQLTKKDEEGKRGRQN